MGRCRRVVTIQQMLFGSIGSLVDFPLFVKSSDETRTLDTTLAADSDLQFDTEPNTIYYIRGAFIAYAGSNPSLKWTLGHTGDTDAALFGARQAGNLDDPSGFLVLGNNDFWMITAAMMAAGTPVDVTPGSATTTDRAVGFFEGILSVGASGGVFSLKWAQNFSHANDTTIKAGSWLHRQIVSSEVYVKSADTSRTATTTATADPDLQAVLAADTDYVMHLLAHGRAGATPDFKIGIDDGGGTPTYFGGLVKFSNSAYTLATIPNGKEQILKPIEALTAAATMTMNGSDAAGTGNFFDLECAGRFSGAANPFALAWSQNTSSATPTTILADSYLLVRAVDSPDQLVWKTADETRASDATLTNDDELSVTLEAGRIYLISIVALFTSGATPDFKCALEFTGDTTDFTGIVDWQGADSLINVIASGAETNAFTGSTGAFSTQVVPGNNAASTYGGVRYTGLLRVGASGGDLHFKWAQNVAGAAATTVVAGSYILAERKE